jgi:iron complex transport system ATP-binding protein
MSHASDKPVAPNATPVPASFLLEAEDVGFSVGKGSDLLSILHGAKMTARSGEFIGILGPNGSGKTTFLKRIANLLPGSGSIRIDGQVQSEYTVKELAHRVGFLHQDTRVPFSFTAREVVEMGRHPFANALADPTGDEDRKAVDRSLREAGCFDFADKPVTTLSAGERQRVMLARVLAQETPLILLDEPTSNLDILHASEVFDLLRDKAAAGRCVVAVMHDLRAAAKYCTRIVLLYKGTIVADGDPEEVLHEGHVSYVFEVPARTFRNPADEWDYYIL